MIAVLALGLVAATTVFLRPGSAASTRVAAAGVVAASDPATPVVAPVPPPTPPVSPGLTASGPTSASPTSASPVPPGTSPRLGARPDPAAQVLALVNQERARAGCPAVTPDTRLAAAAQAHSADMAQRRYFDHTAPDGTDPGQRITAAGYAWSAYGENIAAGYPDAVSVMRGWMNSPGHRENILNCRFGNLGVGLYLTPDHGGYWTQDFAAP